MHDRAKNLMRHIGTAALALLVCLGIPGVLCVDVKGLVTGEPDAASGASLALPEQPSGDFVVLVNTERHPDTLAAWSDFFLEKPVGVIMEDISCLAAEGDAAGIRLAERYQARLAENQMTLRRENALLVVSRAREGLFDAVILSRELAEAYGLAEAGEAGGAAVIEVKGAEE